MHQKLTQPLPAQRALRKLGTDIANARRRRRISTSLMAERADISRTTLVKIEKGDSGVSIGSYATVLYILGMIDGLSDLIDLKNDTLGIELEEEQLPKRIRYKHKTNQRR
jgi:DNA-binding XRE family transcriptional regulator